MVGVAFLNRLLVKVLSMGFPEALAAQNSFEQREAGIAPEECQQQQEGVKTTRPSCSRADGQAAESVAKKAAAGIPHENLGRRPVPEEKA